MTRLRKNAPSILLSFLVVIFVANPVAKELELGTVSYAMEGVLMFAMLTAVFAEGGRSFWKRPGVWAVFSVFVLRGFVTRWHGGDTDAYRALLIFTEIYTALVLFQICYVLVGRFTRGGAITGNTVAGIAAVYILLSLAFGSLHIADFAYEGSNAFNGIDRELSQDLKSHESSLNTWGPDFMYYSIVTQTTLGYGDITPHSPIARGLAVAQTIVGQLFLAIVLARVVAMELANRQDRSE